MGVMVTYDSLRELAEEGRSLTESGRIIANGTVAPLRPGRVKSIFEERDLLRIHQQAYRKNNPKKRVKGWKLQKLRRELLKELKGEMIVRALKKGDEHIRKAADYMANHPFVDGNLKQYSELSRTLQQSPREGLFTIGERLGLTDQQSRIAAQEMGLPLPYGSIPFRLEEGIARCIQAGLYHTRFSSRDVGTILGTAPSTVRKRWQKERKQLANQGLEPITHDRPCIRPMQLYDASLLYELMDEGGSIDDAVDLLGASRVTIEKAIDRREELSTVLEYSLSGLFGRIITRPYITPNQARELAENRPKVERVVRNIVNGEIRYL